MTNDMIAMASNWEERLLAPKDEKNDDPQVWRTSFPLLITLTKWEKNVNPKAMITYKIPTTIGQLHTNYKHTWASERFFQGWGAVVDFPYVFSRVGAKWQNMVFAFQNRTNEPFLLRIVKSMGAMAPLPPLPTPMQAPLSKATEHVKGISGPCGHCGLCGNHGELNKSMVSCVSQVMSKN